MRFTIIIVLLFGIVFNAPQIKQKIEKVEATYERKGNQLEIKNGGPFNYHIDITNVYKLVDGSNQLMAIATKMVHHTPRSIFDIGFGVGCLSRYFLHENKALRIEATDLDFKTIQNVYAPIVTEYLTHIPSDEFARLGTIKPSDGKQLISQIFSRTTFDVVWLDILDDNYKNPANLLFDSDFFAKLKDRIAFHGGVVVALNGATNDDLRRIKQYSGMNMLHLEFANGDLSKQAQFSVVILTKDNKLNCDRLDSAVSDFKMIPLTIRKPSCKSL